MCKLKIRNRKLRKRVFLQKEDVNVYRLVFSFDRELFYDFVKFLETDIFSKFLDMSVCYIELDITSTKHIHGAPFLNEKEFFEHLSKKFKKVLYIPRHRTLKIEIGKNEYTEFKNVLTKHIFKNIKSELYDKILIKLLF